MFARITVIHVCLDRIDEAIELYRKSVVPEARKQKGFIGAYFMVNRKLGKGAAITFWKNEQDAVANEENLYYQEQLAKFLPFYSEPTTVIREGYEVHICVSIGPAKKKASKKARK